MSDACIDVAPVENLPELHNNAYDSILTRGVAKVFEAIAKPLIEHIYRPITEKNHTLGVIAVNSTLTLPRIPLEKKLGKIYEDSLERGNKRKAVLAIFGKLLVKASDGIDGPVARGSDAASEGGALLDPFADMFGMYNDSEIIKKQARKNKDYLTEGLMNTRLLVDVGVIAVGGIANSLAAKYAERKGVVLEDKEQPKALSMGKAKFGLSTLGDTALLASYVSPEADSSQKLKRAGQILTGASIVAGIASIFQYGKAAINKIRRVRDLNKLTS